VLSKRWVSNDITSFSTAQSQQSADVSAEICLTFCKISVCSLHSHCFTLLHVTIVIQKQLEVWIIIVMMMRWIIHCLFCLSISLITTFSKKKFFSFLLSFWSHFNFCSLFLLYLSNFYLLYYYVSFLWLIYNASLIICRSIF